MQACNNCGHLNPRDAIQCEECAMNLDDRTIFQKNFKLTPEQLSNSGGAAFQRGATVPGECLLVLMPVGGRQGLPIHLTSTTYALLGRVSSDKNPSAVDLTPLGAHKLGVSREHARINIRGNAVQVMDLGSSNGTFINDQRLLANQYYGIEDGDEITLGRLRLQVRLDMQP
ncbi:FHA domain-containing protein [Chloroflexota bacterium]